ncbi:MAG: class I SAM-dependent methyltransferase, partial [Pseudomonadales bacterium]|nr:class I SAM-dependent methyltransferase [Pseudomonadales bacterium]
MDKTAELIAKKYGRDGASVVKSYQGLNFSKQIQFIVDNCSCETAEVLDVGCGTGAFVVQAAIKGLEVTGIDTFQESDGMDLKIALSRVAELDINIRTQFVGGSALNLPFPDHSFDVVTTFGMYEHLLPDRRQGALKEMYRVLRPGGFIFFVAGPTVFNPIDQHIPWLPFANWLPRR